MAATITRQLASIADVAALARTVHRYIADGQVEAVPLGRKTLRIKVGSIERFIDALLGPTGASREASTTGHLVTKTCSPTDPLLRGWRSCAATGTEPSPALTLQPSR